MVDPLLHRPGRSCPRTRRCPPPGSPSSTTCRPPTWPRPSRRWPEPGIVESRPGPLGGYRLARPPSDITLLDVVLAVDGDDAAFRCREIRQRGPAATAGSPRLPPAVRHRAGDVAGRGRVASRAGGHDGRRHGRRVLRDRASPSSWCAGPSGSRTSTYDEGAGHEGVRCRCHGRAGARHGPAAGRRRSRGAGCGSLAGEGRPAPRPGGRAGDGRPVRPGVGARRRRRVPGRDPHGHQHPAAHQRPGRATPGPPTTASAARAPASSPTPAATPGWRCW